MYAASARFSISGSIGQMLLERRLVLYTNVKTSKVQIQKIRGQISNLMAGHSGEMLGYFMSRPTALQETNRWSNF